MTRRAHSVAVLGATGAVGQTFIRLLENHPWFELAELAASERSAGKPYGEAARWVAPAQMPRSVAEKTIVTVRSGARVGGHRLLGARLGSRRRSRAGVRARGQDRADATRRTIAWSPTCRSSSPR